MDNGSDGWKVIDVVSAPGGSREATAAASEWLPSFAKQVSIIQLSYHEAHASFPQFVQF